ncbi:PQQ-binding-like beta-propeller repeat protein [bacterium]|nr:PQQ-binding-like beta-propeller repeat protein [bacterium]
MTIRPLAALLCIVACSSVQADTAADILEASGVKGGLIVHVGASTGILTAGLHANDSYLVHGLTTSPSTLVAVRQTIAKMGLYGPVSADVFSGAALPYIDNSVNLVVAEDLGKLPMAEVMRALCPKGVAYIKQGDTWTKTVKPRPAAIDEWTHFLHGPGNNAVAQDSVVGPPRRLQWLGGPKWGRHHDHMSSVSAVVTAGGRVFTIFDEGSRASILLPPKWTLIARDAFNGTILWKRPMERWFSHMMRLKSGPAVLPRRLVAVGDRVYVTLDIDGPLVALDAATGKTVRTYPDTIATQEILVSDGALFLVVDKGEGDASRIWSLADRRIMAIEPETRKTLWATDCTVVPMTLAADAAGVVFHAGKNILRLDRKTGRTVWSSRQVPLTSTFQSFYGATLVLYNDVVLFSGGETAGKQTGTWYTEGRDTLTALSAKTGETLWAGYHPPSGYRSAEDVLVAGGLVWTGETTSGKVVGEFTGRDVRTGEVKSKFIPDVQTYWFHHRCHRGKATEKYLLMSRAGIEFIDHQAKHWEPHHWIRGACLYGVMPANGLIYAPQHPCACYPESKQFGFTAAAPAGKHPAGDEATRLVKGPAYAAIPQSALPTPQSADWPTYRGNAARSGRTTATVPADLKPAWETKLGGDLSAVTVAEGKLFVASIDRHTVHGLDAETGKALWTAHVGGRVDSPPTVWQGRVIFGSADGYVYSLRATDGALAWRFRAAPVDRRLVSFEQLESVWPVHGSVLVQDGAVHCVAGRSMFLDGGLRLLKLDATTGRKLAETVLDDRDPESGKNLQVHVKGLDMPVALPDILSSDGGYLYMRSQRFDLDGRREDIAPRAVREQTGTGAHLFCPSGFLDGSYWHRTYMMYGRTFAGGYSGYSQAGKVAPSGKILVFDDETVYGFGRKAQYYRWTTPIEHHLFADAKGVLRSGGGGGSPGGPWVSIGNSKSLDPTGKPVTVEAWVKAEGPNGVVLARGGNAQGYALLIQKGIPKFVVRANVKLSAVSAKETIGKGWTHLAGMLTADKRLKLFLDGTLVAAAPATGLMTAEPAQPMEIGADDGGAVGDYDSPSAFAGAIDEVRVFHGAVTDAEIAQHAAKPDNVAVANASLVLHLPLDGNAKDTSGNKNNGSGGGNTVAGKLGKATHFASAKTRRPVPRKKGRGFDHRWAEDLPFIVRAMVLADKTLFIAGPADIIDEDAFARRTNDPEVIPKLAEQDAILRGSQGAILWAVSAKDGSKLAELKLDALPRFDGIAAAGGRLYIATTDGRVLCLAK